MKSFSESLQANSWITNTWWPHWWSISSGLVSSHVWHNLSTRNLKCFSDLETHDWSNWIDWKSDLKPPTNGNLVDFCYSDLRKINWDVLKSPIWGRGGFLCSVLWKEEWKAVTESERWAEECNISESCTNRKPASFRKCLSSVSHFLSIKARKKWNRLLAECVYVCIQKSVWKRRPPPGAKTWVVHVLAPFQLLNGLVHVCWELKQKCGPSASPRVLGWGTLICAVVQLFHNLPFVFCSFLFFSPGGCSCHALQGFCADSTWHSCVPYSAVRATVQSRM